LASKAQRRTASGGRRPAERSKAGVKAAKAAKPTKPAAKRKASTRTGYVGRVTAGERAELLLSVSNRLASHQTLDEQLETLVDMVTTVLGAERGSLFLNDPQSGELYSRVAQGDIHREIRLLNHVGVAGRVYTNGEGMIIHDAYASEFFNRSVDEQTGFTTKTLLCAPVRTVNGEVIGVAEVLNRLKGRFTKDDLALLEAMTTQAAVALQGALYVEKMEKSRVQELEFLGVVSEVSSELQLGPLLQKIMSTVTRMLNADRSTLFINDDKTDELYTEIGQGLGATRIRFPNHLGIAGAVFTSGNTVNIPHAYADLRFNPSFDKQTGFFTRSILCVPVVNKDGRTIGVTQVLNRKGGPFTSDDESRLKAFTAQVSIGLENAKLFDDVQNMKNYNESMLESMSNGVVTLDEEGKIVTCNAAGLQIMRVEPDDILKIPAAEFFTDKNAWMVDKITRAVEDEKIGVFMDAEMKFSEEDETISANVTFLPLISAKQEKLGSMIMIEDISSEKRVKSTMSRYMDPSLADQLIAGGEDILGGKSSMATVLFSDIRGFTTFTEELGAQGTVTLLNEYFTVMVDCIQREEGMLDKFIGDAIMAVFGMPFIHDDDEDRGVRAAVSMIADLQVFNQEREARGQMAIDMGIGLNSDEIVSGNIGSPKRMDYTVIGDGVNLAARLESACKQYAARILISENTYKRLRGTYRSREVDRVVVKGKTEPVGVYEVLDYYTEETFPNLMEVLNQFKGGLERYRAGAWDEAIGAFEKGLALNPADKLSQIYIDRCELLKSDPPGGDWDGVWVMTSK
jgi:adenylate cyclase